MAACTFFGNADTSDIVAPALREAIITMIVHHGVTQFYVGHQGNFDALALLTLRDLQKEYIQIRYQVVLAYPARCTGKPAQYGEQEVLRIEELGRVHPRQAIPWRNRWMIDHSDYVIACVAHGGGAAHYMQRAMFLEKKVINLAGEGKMKAPDK